MRQDPCADLADDVRKAMDDVKAGIKPPPAKPPAEAELQEGFDVFVRHAYPHLARDVR